MVEDEAGWLARGGFHWFEYEPLYSRVTARQLALLGAAWLRRFARYWAAPASFYTFAPILRQPDTMSDAVDFLDRWADGLAGPTDWGDAVHNAREAARYARGLFEDLVEDNDEGVMRFRADGTAAAAVAVEFVCELLAVCGTPERTLADALAPFASPARPDPPPFVLAREWQRPRGSTRLRVLDQLESALRHLSQVVADAAGWRSEDENSVYAAESRAERELMHELFGNPFRPVAFAPEWRTGAAVALAQGMYASRDFGAMPILADALQDAGCNDPDLLAHCRDAQAGGGSGEPAGGSPAQRAHVRGCWVIDLVLGKA